MDTQSHHPPSRPPLPTPLPSDSSTTTKSTAPTASFSTILYEKDDDASYRGGGGSHSSDDTGMHVRRRWTHVALVALVVLFLGSCGGGALSGVLFAGIGEVKGVGAQWIAQGVVLFASLTSLLYTTFHLRASRLSPSLFQTPFTPLPTLNTTFQHPLQSHATLTIRAAVLLWAAALPAVAMGVYHGGRTILKLDLFVCVLGVLTTTFLVFVVHKVSGPFELPSLTPGYVSHGGLEGGGGARLRGGGGGERGKKNKESVSSVSSDSGWSGSGSGGSSTRASSRSGRGGRERGGGGVMMEPAPVYTGAVGGPRPFPGVSGGGGNAPKGGNNRRVLTRLSVIGAAIPPAPAPAPAASPAQQSGGSSPVEKVAGMVTGAAAGVTGWIWGKAGNSPGGNNGNNGGGEGSGLPSPVSDYEGAVRRPVSAMVKDDMPGTFHGEGQHRGW